MQSVCFSSFPLSPSLKPTLLQLYVSSFHHTYFTIVNGTWRLCWNAAQTFLWCLRKDLSVLSCQVFTDGYHCLCPSQSSPTLGTTACWCTGWLSEPPPPGTLCSTTGETAGSGVSHSTQSIKASLLQATHVNLDESVYFHLSAFSQSFDLHLADGTHIEVVHCWTASKSMSTRQKIIK